MHIKITHILALRLGLGLVFIYAGLNSLIDPESWVGYIPQFIFGIMGANTFLAIHSVLELIIGLSLLVGIKIQIASLAAFLSISSILIFYGVDNITFRDFGLALAALALFIATRDRNITTIQK